MALSSSVMRLPSRKLARVVPFFFAVAACGTEEAAPNVANTDPGTAGTGAKAGAAGKGASGGTSSGGASTGGSGGTKPGASGAAGQPATAGNGAGGGPGAAGKGSGSGAGGTTSAGSGGSGTAGAAGQVSTGGTQAAGGTDPGSAGTGQGTAGSGQAGGPVTPPGPTCAKAGGDRCGKTKADCAGLASFDSSDCAFCCAVPKNPVIDAGFADPFIVREGDTYYAFATGGAVRRRSSKDLIKWGVGDAALDKSPWKSASAGFWAPTVYQAKNGKWVLYYAAETNAPNNQQHCIGKAVANAVTGDFTDKLGKPFICATSHWSIDPSVFQDKDGKDYLLWRQDTAAMSKGNVFIQRLDENGDLVGQSHELISRASKEPSWEFDAQGGVLENPAMVRNGNVYHLFYSGNRWETAKYANGHATCEAPFGPCKKTSTTAPWQGSKGQMLGPGGADTVVAKDGTLFMYMHGWDAPKVGDDAGAERKLWLYRLDFDQQKPSLSAP